MQWEIPLSIGAAYLIVDLFRAADIYRLRRDMENHRQEACSALIGAVNPDTYPPNATYLAAVRGAPVTGPVSYFVKWTTPFIN